ncbi:MAG: sulfite exporter TauE/SafE family protein, partial [Chloroflexi bacterium]|nr:sulfite exporter TauE/SafE family protein [Chloroflexota bacterium]
LLASAIVPAVNVLQLVRHRAHAGKQVRRIVPLFVGGVLGVPMGVGLLAILSGQAITLVLGGFTLLYVFTSFFKLRLLVPPRWEPLLSPAVGVTAGLCTGAVGVSGPVLASYLLALDLTASAFLFSLSLMFTILSTYRLVGLIVLDLVTPTLVSLSLLLLTPALLGLKSGMWLQSRLPKQTFQRAVLLVLLAAGLSLIERGLS